MILGTLRWRVRFRLLIRVSQNAPVSSCLCKRNDMEMNKEHPRVYLFLGMAFRLFPGNSRKCGNFVLLENRIFFSKLLIGGPFSEKLKHFLWPNLTFNVDIFLRVVSHIPSSLLQYFAHN